MSAVTVQEIVKALRKGIPAGAFRRFDWLEANKKLVERIEQHGIARPSGPTPVAWAIDTPYGRAYSYADELLGKWPVPDGWVLVPKEPTFKMCEAGGFKWESPWEGGFPSAYRAMLAAAPEVSLEVES